MLLAVILCLFRVPALLEISTAFIGGAQGDGGLYVWLVKSNLRDLGVLPWFNTLAFYPYSQSLAWSDNFILPSFGVGALLQCGLPFVLAYNLVLLLANLLNGYCTYRLVFRLGGSAVAALFAGALFMCYAYLGVHLGHPQLQFAFFLPLAAAALFDFIAAPAYAAAARTGLCVSLAFLCAVYHALFTLIACGALALGFVMLHPKRLGRREALQLLLGGAAGLAPVLFFLAPYLAVKETFGERGLYEAYYFSASLFSYLSTSAATWLYRGRPFNDPGEEANLFPGFTVLILGLLVVRRLCGAKRLRMPALMFLIPLSLSLIFSMRMLPFLGWQQLLLCALGLWAALLGMLLFLRHMGALERTLKVTFITDRDVLALCLFASFIFLAISFGPLGNPEKGQAAIGPFTALHAFVPGFDALRAVSRAGIAAVFFLIVAAALLLARRMPAQMGAYSIPLLLLFGLFENFNYTFPLQEPAPRPRIFDALAAKIGRGEAFVVLPLATALDRNGLVASWGEYAAVNTNYMNWAFDVARPMLNGYSGIKTKFMREQPRELAGFPDKRSLLNLQRIAGLRWVVVLPRYIKAFNAEVFLARAQSLAPALRLTERDAEGSLLFELAGEITIDPSSVLLVPSYPRGTLTLQAAARGGPAVLEAALPDHAPGAPLLRQELPVPGRTESVTVFLPQTSDNVRPLRVTFSVKGDAVLRHTYFNFDD